MAGDVVGTMGALWLRVDVGPMLQYNRVWERRRERWSRLPPQVLGHPSRTLSALRALWFVPSRSRPTALLTRKRLSRSNRPRHLIPPSYMCRSYRSGQPDIIFPFPIRGVAWHPRQHMIAVVQVIIQVRYFNITTITRRPRLVRNWCKLADLLY